MKKIITPLVFAALTPLVFAASAAFGGPEEPQTARAMPAVTATVTKVHDFTKADGIRVRDSMTAGPDGALYGTAWQGGSGSCGTVFRFDPVASAYSVIHDFTPLVNGRNLDGCNPVAPVSFHDGRLYAVTRGGGQGGNPLRAALGAIVSMNLDGSHFARVHDFGTAKPGGGYIDGGGSPQGGLVWDTTHNVAYAAETAGIYRFNPADGSAVLLYAFPPVNANRVNVIGSNPYGSPAFGADGRLYGFTMYGGANGRGTVYAFDLAANRPRLIYTNPAYSFSGNTDNTPLNSPIMASDGASYFAMEFGCANGSGCLAKVERTVTIIHEFGVYPYSPDGSLPLGTLVEAPDGYLYGTTMYGSAGYGTIYRIGKDGRGFQSLYHFMLDRHGGPTSMCWPYAGLTVVGTSLYGTTGLCGKYGGGTIFRVDLH